MNAELYLPAGFTVSPVQWSPDRIIASFLERNGCFQSPVKQKEKAKGESLALDTFYEGGASCGGQPAGQEIAAPDGARSDHHPMLVACHSLQTVLIPSLWGLQKKLF